MSNKLIDNRYRIIERLGSGDMGDVYKVKDSATNTILALKASPIKHIQREFLTLSKLHHPNIIKVYDFGTTYLTNQQSNQYFFTMEYIDGRF